MLTELQKLFNDVAGREDIELTPKTKLKELPLSSLGLVQLICTIEDEYDIEVSNADMKGFRTVKDVVEYLDKTIG